MSKTKLVTITAKIEGGEALTPNSEVVAVTDLSVLYVKHLLGQDELRTYTPKIIINRLVDMSSCKVEEKCVPFTETCDKVFLPAGRYQITTCPINSPYYKDVEELEIVTEVIIEPVSDSYKAALELNALGCC